MSTERLLGISIQIESIVTVRVNDIELTDMPVGQQDAGEVSVSKQAVLRRASVNLATLESELGSEFMQLIRACVAEGHAELGGDMDRLQERQRVLRKAKVALSGAGSAS